MVVWLFSGGGEAEVRGMVPFLKMNFSGCIFLRKTPIRRKPGPKPSLGHNQMKGYGRTGKSLANEIQEQLQISLSEMETCDLILVIDDLDCRDPIEQNTIFLEAINTTHRAVEIDKFIGFASPELEAWIIADWENTFARHPDFRGRHQRMRWWLSTQKNISFDSPESFGEYDSERDTCNEKMSDAIIESSTTINEDRYLSRFSKSTHTPVLLWKINPDTVCRKCPLFRELYNFLDNFCKYSN